MKHKYINRKAGNMLKFNLKNIYKATFVIIGTIIGAGFASRSGDLYVF